PALSPYTTLFRSAARQHDDHHTVQEEYKFIVDDPAERIAEHHLDGLKMTLRIKHMAELRHLPAQKHDDQCRQQHRPVAHRTEVTEKLKYFLSRREARSEDHPDIGKTDFDGFLLSFTKTINSEFYFYKLHNSVIKHKTKKIQNPDGRRRAVYRGGGAYRGFGA